MCDYGNDRVKPVKIRLFLKNKDKILNVDGLIKFELFHKYKRGIKEFKENVDFKIYYGISHTKKQWESICVEP